MTLTIKHAKITSGTVNNDVEVDLADWNEAHTISGTIDAEQMPELTGDVTMLAGSTSTTLATVNENVGTFGSATQVAQVAVNAKGLTTAASNVTVTPAIGSVTGLGTGVATFLATPSSANLRAALTDETGTDAAYFVGGALGTPASGTLTNCTAFNLTTTGSSGAATYSGGTLNIPEYSSSIDPSDLRGYISGLTLSNDAVTPNTILNIAAGVATSDDQAALMSLSSAYTKTTGSWAVGTGNGALDTGSIASSTWYHVFLIERTDTGVIDILFSTSATAPTMPTSYTKKRRIGSFKTDGSSNILGFVQLGNDFIWKALGTTYYLNNPGTSAVLVALNVPLGVAVRAKATFFLQNTNSTRIGAFITSTFQTDVAANVGSNASIMTGLNGASGAVQQEFDRWTNTSQQIRYRLDVSNASTDVFINTFGWYDPL